MGGDLGDMGDMFLYGENCTNNLDKMAQLDLHLPTIKCTCVCPLSVYYLKMGSDMVLPKT